MEKKLTVLEKKVIENLKYADCYPENVFIQSLFDGEIDNKVLRGVLSSLVKKNIIDIETSNDWDSKGLVSFMDKNIFSL